MVGGRSKSVAKRKRDNMPARNRKNFLSTKEGAGMTEAGVRRTVERIPEASCRPLSPRIILQESEQSEGGLFELVLLVK